MNQNLRDIEKNGDEKKKRSLALKGFSLFNDENDELDEIKTKDERDEVLLLSKKLPRILKDEGNEEKRKTLL